MKGHAPVARRATVPILCALTGVLGSLFAPPAGAQGQPAVTRPDYRVTRFDENWAVLRGVTEPSRLDGLKYLPLTDSGTVYLSLGGQLRYRAEGVRHFLLSPAPGSNDAFGLGRALLHADLHLGSHLRLFVEGKHALAYGRELPGGTRPLDQDEWALQNAFVDLACCGATASNLALRLGRQELLLGSQRLVSPADWTNTRRTFEGARLQATLPAITLDAFWARPLIVRVDARNERDPATAFWGLTARPAATRGLAWELYTLVLSQGDSTRLWGHTGAHERVTLGGRVVAPIPATAARIEVEGGWQGGKLAGQPVSAWFVASDLSRVFRGAWAKPTLSLGFDYASGDGDPADGRIGTFHQLYALGHAYAGYMDLLGRQNLVEARGVVSANPLRGVQTRASLHHFLRARTEDAVYNVGGGVLRAPSGVANRTIGSELNLTVGYRVNRHSRFEVGYGHFAPGSFMKATAAGATASDWVYATSALTF